MISVLIRSLVVKDRLTYSFASLTRSFKVTENILWYLCFIYLKFFSKTLDPLVAKNGSKQFNNTSFGFLLMNMNKHKQAFKIGFVYLQKIWSLDFLYNLHAPRL